MAPRRDESLPTLFGANPRRRTFGVTDRALTELCVDVSARFSDLPLHHAGESSEIRRTSVPGLLAQRFVPSLNSITHRRKGRVDGTDRLRHDISRVLWHALHERGQASCHLATHDGYVIITEERIPPVEVIVKAALTGTPSRVYHGLLERTDRFGREFDAHQAHEPYVRFDFRNPLTDTRGDRLRDECMPRALANRLIDTAVAERSALANFATVSDIFQGLGLELLDACFLFDESGRVLTYELSPDNMRVKAEGWRAGAGAGEFDKDLWRRGAEPARIIEQWTALRDRLEALGD